MIEAVLEFRRSNGLYQRDIADVLLVERSFIANIESPKHLATYNIQHISNLSFYFDVPMKLFLPDRGLTDEDTCEK